MKSPCQLAGRSSLIAISLLASACLRQRGLPLLFLSAGLAFVQPCAGHSFAWECTGSLQTFWDNHTATLLSDGEGALVAGGLGSGCAQASAELYDPTTATLLADGSVLIAAGIDAYRSGALASAELYNPAIENFTYTGSLNCSLGSREPAY